MARIPEAEIERLKREIALERLVEARGVVLKRKGADLVGRCPFGTHQDSEPSFVVTPAKNLWHCFGCQQGGSVIDWVMRVEGVSFRHAVELLRDDNASLVTAAMIVPAGPRTRLTREGLGVKRSTVPKLESPFDPKVDDRELLLTVDEDREQTRAIHRLQRERQTLEGLLARRDRDHILAVHRNAQRLLRPVHVTNPFARELTFLDDQTRTRRDHLKYLTLIRSIALLHQYQRPTKNVTHHGQAVQYIEATIDDIAAANALAHEALGRSLDELAPQTRRLLMLIDEMVTASCQQLSVERSDHRFSRRQVREFTGWGNTQLRLHFSRLEELEYLLVHRGGRGQSFVYELLYDGNGKDGQPFLCGLIEVEKLHETRTYDANLAGVNDNLAGSNRGQNGRVSGGWRNESTVAAKNVNLETEASSLETPLLRTAEPAKSYVAAGSK